VVFAGRVDRNADMALEEADALRSEDVLREYGFLMPRSEIAYRAAGAAETARRIGFPVALKISSPDVIHKTDLGGVELNLRSESEVEAAFERIMSSVRSKCPDAVIDGMIVQEMCTGGREIIIGLVNDAQFGPSIMFGLGGVFVEVLEDVSFRVLPIAERDANQMIEEIKGHKILEGYRGLPAISRTMLVDLLLKAGRMGMDIAPRLESVDLNPIMLWDDDHRVLDARIVVRGEETPPVERKPNTAYLEKFFEAKSVALVGASATPGKIGNAVLDSLANQDFEGRVYPINPTREEVMGLKSYPSLAAVPEPVELVVVTVALSLMPQILAECATKGIHNIVIVSAGGKELGGEGAELEATIRELAAQRRVRIIGPNCIGVFSGKTRLDTFFQIHERMDRPRNGVIAMLTQSGTVGAAFLEAMSDVGISKFVSYGNRMDVDEADLLAYWVDDPETKVIACYVEGFDDGRKFLSTAQEATQRKPVVIFKAGRTQQAARASISHTGFFGGSHELCRGAFKQAGLIAMDSLEQLCAAAKALAFQPVARGHRVAMISNGAGTMVQAIDLVPEYDLEMIPLASQSVERLREVYPPYFLVQNPVDVTGSATSGDYEVGIEALLDDPHVDIIMPWFVFQDTPLDEGIVQVLGRVCQRRQKPILCGAIGGSYTERMCEAIEAEGVPVYHSVREWMAAAKALAHAKQQKE
jgi:3-hydroxypropionyl-CoA synthetase (ADP-forming)